MKLARIPVRPQITPLGLSRSFITLLSNTTLPSIRSGDDVSITTVGFQNVEFNLAGDLVVITNANGVFILTADGLAGEASLRLQNCT